MLLTFKFVSPFGTILSKENPCFLKVVAFHCIAIVIDVYSIGSLSWLVGWVGFDQNLQIFSRWGFQYVLCSSLFRENRSNFTFSFQMGWCWNHQLVNCMVFYCLYMFRGESNCIRWFKVNKLDPLVGGYLTVLKGHVNSPSQTGHVRRIAR